MTEMSPVTLLIRSVCSTNYFPLMRESTNYFFSRFATIVCISVAYVARAFLSVIELSPGKSELPSVVLLAGVLLVVSL